MVLQETAPGHDEPVPKERSVEGLAAGNVYEKAYEVIQQILESSVVKTSNTAVAVPELKRADVKSFYDNALMLDGATGAH